MGQLTAAIDQFGLVAVLLFGAVGLAGLVLADQVLRRPWFTVVALIGVDLVLLVDATVQAWNGIDVEVAVPFVGPLATVTTVAAAGLTLARPRADRPGELLWGFGALFAGTTIVLDVLHGAMPGEDALVMLLVMSALWCAPRLDVALVADVAKVVVGAFVGMSFLLWVAGAPGVSDAYGSSWLPFVHFRMDGVFRHANSLGPMALLYLLLEYARPTPQRAVRWSLVGAGGLLLLLSQSKTAWGAGLLALTAILLADVRRRRLVVGLGLGTAVVAAALVLFGLQVGDVLRSDEVDDVRTLTGRTDVWAAGIDRWLESDLLAGAGPGVFERYAEETGQEWAGQAHNQMVQTLAEQGIFGAAALLVYMAAMAWVAWKHGPRSRNASLALVAALLIRTVTETPLDSFGLQHLVTFALLLAWEREAASDAPGRVGRAARVPLRAVSTAGSPGGTGPRTGAR